MIKLTRRDLLKQDNVDAIVNAVNCVGVMGGLVLPRHVINFPTKDHWRNGRSELMEAGTCKPYLQVRAEQDFQAAIGSLVKTIAMRRVGTVGRAIEGYEQGDNRALQGVSHDPERIVDARDRSLE